MLLRNAWYIGAWADELGDKPLARRICGDPIVLFRDGSDPCRPLLSSRGTAASRQPRRGRYRVRLSRPRFQHGRTLRGHPGKKLIPQDAQVRSYPSVERDQLVWLWMGDPALADPARIVDFRKQDDEHSMMPARRIGMPKIARIVGDEDEIAVR